MMFVVLAWLAACTGASAPMPDLPALPPPVVRVAPPPAGEARPMVQLNLAVTGEVRGEIEPCGCPTVPYGGFVRRGAFLDLLRKEDVPLFVLDAGEMLLKATDVEARLERGRTVLDLARAIGLDAWAAAPLDLVPGGPVMLAGTGALSANWREAGREVLPGARVIERGGVRLGVIGLSGSAEGFGGDDPVAAVRSALTPGAADAWVVLSNADPDVTEAVAAGVPGLALVVSLRGETRDAPRTTAGAPIVETADRGKWVTVVRAFVATSPGPWMLAETGPPLTVANLTRAAASAGGAATRAQNQVELTEARSRLAATIAGQSWMVIEDQPLGSEFDGDGPVRTRVDAFKRRAVDDATARVERAPGPTYGTAGYCTRCHDAFTARWVGQPHARALEALVAKGQAENPECLGCHTTAWGKPGGYAEPTTIARMTWKGVQCEACHGPLAAHPNGSAKPLEVTRKTCLGCHDSANSPSFDYDRYLAGVGCVQLLADRKAGGIPSREVLQEPASGASTPPIPAPASPR